MSGTLNNCAACNSDLTKRKTKLLLGRVGPLEYKKGNITIRTHQPSKLGFCSPRCMGRYFKRLAKQAIKDARF